MLITYGKTYQEFKDANIPLKLVFRITKQIKHKPKDLEFEGDTRTLWDELVKVHYKWNEHSKLLQGEKIHKREKNSQKETYQKTI